MSIDDGAPIAAALGLDPKRVYAFSLRCEAGVKPHLEVEMRLDPSDIDGLDTVIRHYRLLPLGDDQ